MDLKQLCEMNAVSGFEQSLRRAILAEVSQYEGVKAEIDRMGNVVCRKKSSIEAAKHVLVTANMDECGFMVSSATKEGFLRIMPIGKLDSRMAVSKRIVIGEKKLSAVIGSKPIHLQSQDERKRALSFKEIYADIGAKSEEEALQHAPRGSWCAFDTDFMTFGQGFVSGKALSARAGVYNLLRLLSSSVKADVTAVFTTLHNAGCRGASVVSFSCKPDYAIVLSACLCNDLGNERETTQVSRMGEGVSINFMDKGAISSRKLFRDTCTLAESSNIPHQIERGLSPSSDAGAIQNTGYPLSVVTLSVPCRNMNSPCEVMKNEDIDSQLRLTINLIDNL